MIPGRRLKLHPDDLYALGGHRGGINERWFCSTTHASNGPGTPEDEGLSYVRREDGSRVLFKALVDEGGDLLLGAPVMQREKRLEPALQVLRQPRRDPAPHASGRQIRRASSGRRASRKHIISRRNITRSRTIFLTRSWASNRARPKTTSGRCLADWNKGDNGIVNFSRAYRLQPGTGWQINPGILHAPGSLVTYEPQVNSDVFAMFQSEVDGRIVDRALLTKDVPKEKHDDLDFLVSMLDWDANVNPEFGKSNRVFPKDRFTRPSSSATPDARSGGSATAPGGTRRKS